MTNAFEAFIVNDFIPDSLVNLCLDCIVENLDTFSEFDIVNQCLKFKDNIILPAEICEKFLHVYQKKNCVNDNFANMFRYRSQTRVRVVRLHNACITDKGLRCFMEHKPYAVELVECDYLSPASIGVINKNSENLISLQIGPQTNLFSQEPLDNLMNSHRYAINAPKLQQLTVHCRGRVAFPLLLLKPLQLEYLTHLYLSEHPSNTIWVLNELKSLQSLTLHNILWSKEVVDWISTLRTLRHLDISQANEKYGRFSNPNEVLTKLVTNLPLLESLDISGTNLAGTGLAVPALTSGQSDGTEVHVRCDIPGLVSRVNRPLEFLGLYGTLHGACTRHDIPAKIITGDANEEQILAAGEAYTEYPVILTRVLNDLYYMFRNTDTLDTYISRALNIVLEAMERHPYEKNIQISGSATLFYIVKHRESVHIGNILKRKIITTVVDAMVNHKQEFTMMRNGCLTLCQFQIPTDVLFEYDRIVQILLNGVVDLNQQTFVLRVAVYLLNSLACQVDGKQKRFMGDNGAIVKMLNLIGDRLERNICDDVLEVSWSTMWNVTDETPANCRCFLDHRGMEYFLACLQAFPGKEELLRNMMGLLGNVAEVAELRPRLMDPLFVTVFYNLLNSSIDGIEVSYNAAGILAHMASDGSQAWTVEAPARHTVLSRLASAVGRWNLSSERNINYRSFEPVLTLLQTTYHIPQCQYWAVWALANLTTVYPNKYCSLIEKRNGLNILRELIQHPSPDQEIKNLAWTIINNCARHAISPPPGSRDN